MEDIYTFEVWKAPIAPGGSYWWDGRVYAAGDPNVLFVAKIYGTPLTRRGAIRELKRQLNAILERPHTVKRRFSRGTFVVRTRHRVKVR